MDFKTDEIVSILKQQLDTHNTDIDILDNLNNDNSSNNVTISGDFLPTKFFNDTNDNLINAVVDRY